MSRWVSATLLLLLSLVSAAVAVPLEALKSLVLLRPTAAGPSSASCVAVCIENNLLITNARCDVRSLRFASSVAEASFVGVDPGRLQLALTPATALENPNSSSDAAIVELWHDATVRLLHIDSLDGSSHLQPPSNNSLPIVGTEDLETSVIDVDTTTLQVAVFDHVQYVDTTHCADSAGSDASSASVCVLPLEVSEPTTVRSTRSWSLLVTHDTETDAHTLVGLGSPVDHAPVGRDGLRAFTWLHSRFAQPWSESSSTTTTATLNPTSPNNEDRIKGPVVATITTYHEFIVGVRSRRTGESFCTGSLIASRFVLTAAHCADNTTITHVSVGATKTKGGGHGSGDLVQVRRLHRHPLYEPSDILAPYDFLVLELNRATRRTPIALATDRDDDEMLGKRATIFGYGIMDTQNTTSPELRVAQVTLGPANKVCSRQFVFEMDATLMCARPETDTGACSGDSGGPLVLDAGTANQRLLAITSGVQRTKTDGSCVFNDVNWFARVAAARAFIQTTIDDATAAATTETPRPQLARPLHQQD